MDIKKLYYSIGEVSKLTELKQYVLRYWETEFKQLKPQKNRSGNRTYRQADIDTILTIKSLLYDKKFTIVGARKQLNSGVEDMGDGEEGSASSGMSEKQKTALGEIKEELQKILDIISEWSSVIKFGAWRSPVAHLTGGQGVASSNLAAPTDKAFFSGEEAFFSLQVNTLYTAFYQTGKNSSLIGKKADLGVNWRNKTNLINM